MASRADIMRLLHRESAEGGAMVGGCGDMPCQHCDGSGLVGGRIDGWMKYGKGASGAQQRDRDEAVFIADAIKQPLYQSIKSKKKKDDFIKAYKYLQAGVPLPPKRAPRAPRTLAQQEATAKMLKARATSREEAYVLANAWQDKVRANPKCDKVDIRKLLKPGEMAKLRQRLATYDL